MHGVLYGCIQCYEVPREDPKLAILSMVADIIRGCKITINLSCKYDVLIRDFAKTYMISNQQILRSGPVISIPWHAFSPMKTKLLPTAALSTD
jgi:hypothetical protein